MRLTFTILFTVVLFLQITTAQENAPIEYKFETLTIKDGLSQGMVNAIIQDQYGFMWFATNDGLNRFDGYNFSVFKNDVEDSTSIAGNFIRFLFEDTKGRLWIATADNGLDLFDRKTETFIHFKHESNNSNSISSNSVTSICEDKSGHIWVGTIQGLNRLTITENKITKNNFRDKFDVLFTKIIFDKSNPNVEAFLRIDESPLADWRSSNFFADNDGRIWVSTQGKLFQIIAGKNESYEIKNIDIEKYKYPSAKNDYLSRYVQSFVPIKGENKFLMLFENGITEISNQNKSIRFLTTPNTQKCIYTFPVSTDNENNLFAGIDHQLNLFNFSKHYWNKISSYDKNLSPYLNFISCSYLDKNGNTWIGTQGYGLLKYNKKIERFHTTENASINYMSPGINGDVLFLKNPMDDFFYSHDLKTGLTFPPITKTNIKLQKGTHHDKAETKSVIQDKDGSYWIGRIGLYHYEPLQKKTSYYWNQYDNIFPLYDDNKGNLLFGNTHGLVIFDKVHKSSTEFKFPVKSDEGPYDFLQSIYKDQNDLIWLGTLKGLFSFDVQKTKWTHYKNIPGKANSLSYDLIFCICPDPIAPERFLWIGTKSGGLNKFDKTSGNFERFGIKEGLPNDVIYGIVSYANQHLWMSTNNGISMLNLANNTFTNYDEKDGLQGNEFNRNAFCKTSDNTIFFGGLNGFNYFNPKKLIAKKTVPNVLITALKINYVLEDFRKKNAVIKQPLYLTDGITLKHHQNDIAIEFSSLDFTSLKKDKYQYKLEGYDENWIAADLVNKAIYTNLNPGEYIFLVKGSNNDGVWNSNPTKLTIIILAPWYATWWFRLILMTTFLSIIYVIYKYRIKKFKEIQKIKTAISRDLHDDIGANLSTISIFAEIASNPSKTSTDVQVILKKILKFANNSQESMSDIIWMINTKTDNFLNLIFRMQSIYKESLETNDTQVIFKYDQEIENFKLTANQTKSIYLIYKEAINNINKYANASKVEITIMRNNETIEMSIKDNGNGFNQHDIMAFQQRGGNGLGNMKLRSQEINGQLNIQSKINEGTTIILKFPY